MKVCIEKWIPIQRSAAEELKQIYVPTEAQPLKRRRPTKIPAGFRRVAARMLELGICAREMHLNRALQERTTPRICGSVGRHALMQGGDR
jgi:hypothetical protein